ncbi:MAG: hypothetical protein WCP16_13120 [Pseudanabaena sp. ELA645]
MQFNKAIAPSQNQQSAIAHHKAIATNQNQLTEIAYFLSKNHSPKLTKDNLKQFLTP